MVLGILRLLVSARTQVLGTALSVDSVGSSQILHGERRAELVGDRGPPTVQASQPRLLQRQGTSWTLCQNSMQQLGRRPRGRPQHRCRPKSKKNGESSLSSRQHGRHARSSSKKLPPCPSSRAPAKRQHKAAVDACFLVAETGDKVEEQKLRVQQASVEAPFKTSTEAGTFHSGCGRGCGHPLVAPGCSPTQGTAPVVAGARGAFSASSCVHPRRRRRDLAAAFWRQQLGRT